MAGEPGGEGVEGVFLVSGDGVEAGEDGLFFVLVRVGVDGAGIIWITVSGVARRGGNTCSRESRRRRG